MGNVEFAELLKIAMGERNQVQFAADSGLSRGYINRALNCYDGPWASSVSQDTLEKIADASEGRVSVAQLKISLGMEVLANDGRKDFGSISDSRKRRIIAGEMKEGLKQLTANGAR